MCLDETSKQLISETRVPIPAKPGRPARHDYEYARNGTANLFMLFAPLEGWRQVKVTDRHAAVDYAQALKDLADIHFSKARQIVLVQDNLSTHKPASLYQAFPAAEARRLVERFEWHYTPRHGSWLDMAEPEISVLSRQCLDRRIPDKQALMDEVVAWQQIATNVTSRLTGNSPPLTPALNSRGCTQQYERLRVLVVEDDATVRLLITSVLEELGYRHMEAPDAATVLAILQTKSVIDLLITDVGLPVTNGRRLAEIVQPSRPNLKVLFVTGYAEAVAARGGGLAAGMHMLTKPFAFDTLGAKIREMIERNAVR